MSTHMLQSTQQSFILPQHNNAPFESLASERQSSTGATIRHIITTSTTFTYAHSLPSYKTVNYARAQRCRDAKLFKGAEMSPVSVRLHDLRASFNRLGFHPQTGEQGDVDWGKDITGEFGRD